MNLLEVERLSIRYGNELVVDELSFAVGKGESVGLVGESGSGKSQTALAILGLTPREAVVSGSIRFSGADLRRLSEVQLNGLRARHIGIVFQDPSQALNPYLRVGRQLREIVVRHGLCSGTEADERVVEMLAKVGLPDPGRQFTAYPHELSGGMRQRVMLASALIAQPELLIADEPTTALDVTVQAQILELLEEIRDNTALLLITHDLGIVAGRCERMLVLGSGRLVDSGATTALFAAPGHPHTSALLATAPRIDKGEAPESVTGKLVFGVEAATVNYEAQGRKALQAVTDISLSLRAGETLAVVGESGSGKSSLVRAMLGLVPMAGGKVVYAGETLGARVEQRARAQRRDLQLVFQDPIAALDPQMRVHALVGEGLLVHEPQLTAAERLERVSETLGRVGLDAEYLDRFPHELSGGQAQRVAIARALVLRPRVLVCDEAVAALDGSVREQVLALLRQVQDETGLSIIFISHDLAVVQSVSHRVLVMYLGRLFELADNRALFSAPRHPYTRALIDAVPVPDPLVPPRTAPLRGEVPSPLDPPSGCVFHPRCPYATHICAREVPATRDIDGTRVACHRAEELDL